MSHKKMCNRLNVEKKILEKLEVTKNPCWSGNAARHLVWYFKGEVILLNSACQWSVNILACLQATKKLIVNAKVIRYSSNICMMDIRL